MQDVARIRRTMVLQPLLLLLLGIPATFLSSADVTVRHSSVPALQQQLLHARVSDCQLDKMPTGSVCMSSQSHA